MGKTILAWIIAIFAAYLLLEVFVFFLKGVFHLIADLFFLIPIIIIAVPIYLVIRKKFMR